MAEKTHFISDQRLLYILQGGEIFMSVFDPDGLCRNGYVMKIVHGRYTEKEVIPWDATVVFASGDLFVVSGAWTPTEGLAVWELKMPLPENKFEVIPTVPGKTLLEALGDLSSIPVRLQRCLSPTGLKSAPMAKIATLWGGVLFSLEEEALFWDVEGGDKGSNRRPLFDKYIVHYFRSEMNGPIKVEIESRHPLPEGRITVSTELDVYGLSGKKVILDRNLGMGRRFESKCTAVKDKYRIPSLKVAFDLDAALPLFYFKERHSRIKKGYPKSANNK